MANTKNNLLTKEEIAAMKETLKERRDGAQGEAVVLERIAKMPEPDRSMAKKVHAIVRANAPNLIPRTWYGMPAYANKEGKVICWFQDANKFKARYATFSFSDKANLDEGSMWPISFALKKLTGSEEAKIAALVKRALG